jgi:glutaredoxin
MVEVTIFSRSNCHLCDVALETLENFQSEFTFTIEKILIDGDLELESKYGESVPVILINNQPHDFFRVNPDRFRAAMSKL